MPEDKNKVENEEIIEEANNEADEDKTEDDCEEEETPKLSEQEQKIVELEEKIVELNDKILRNEAEYQNIKKRMEREKVKSIEYAYERFAHDMLNVVDSLENGAKSFEVNDSESNELYTKVKEGFDLTLEQFNKVFEKHGIAPIKDTEFDPNIHNAIMQVDSEEHNEGEIVQTFQKGYKIKDRVLRAAMVSVAK